MCRSPLPNKIQPSAMRWRVGRKPTSRSMDFTSCQGQPVSGERATPAATGSAVSRGLMDMTVRDAGMGLPEPSEYPSPDNCYICNNCRAKDIRKVQAGPRSEEHTSELQSLTNIVFRLLL